MSIRYPTTTPLLTALPDGARVSLLNGHLHGIVTRHRYIADEYVVSVWQGEERLLSDMEIPAQYVKILVDLDSEEVVEAFLRGEEVTPDGRPFYGCLDPYVSGTKECLCSCGCSSVVTYFYEGALLKRMRHEINVGCTCFLDNCSCIRGKS